MILFSYISFLIMTIQDIIQVPLDEEQIVQFPGETVQYDYSHQKTQFKKTFDKAINQKLTDQTILEILNPVLEVKTTKIQQVCRHFKDGTCKLGDNCPYIHE